MKTTLHNTIMRRVYYAYAIKTAVHPVTMHGVAMAFLLFALTYFVSIPNVLANMLNVKVGELAPYIFGVFLNTEIWTLFILGGLILTALSLRLCLRSFHVRNMQAV